MPRLRADWINPKPRVVERVEKRILANGNETYITVKVTCKHLQWRDNELHPDVYRDCVGCGVKAYKSNYIPRAFTLEETRYQDDLAKRGGVLVKRGGVTVKAQRASLWDKQTITANTKQKVSKKTGKSYTPRAPKHFNQAVTL